MRWLVLLAVIGGSRSAGADPVVRATVGDVAVRACEPSHRDHGIGVELLWACLEVTNHGHAAVRVEVIDVSLHSDTPGAEPSQPLAPAELRLAGGPHGKSSAFEGSPTARSIDAGSDVRLLVFPRAKDARRLQQRYHVHYWHEITVRVDQTTVTLHAELGSFRHPLR